MSPSGRLDGELLGLARDVAFEAATLLMDHLERDRAEVATKSSGTDMVTDIDRASERLIVTHLLDHRPDDGVVGEEGTDVRGTSGVDWVIDPIDGTTNYLYRHPGFGVSIAARVEGEVRVGVVADPFHRELFWATTGTRAFRDGREIRPRPDVSLENALVATGFSYDATERRREGLVLAGLLPRIRDIRRMGAAAVDLCSAACGRVDAFFEAGLSPWDFAAGALIAAEAGLLVGDLGGGPPSTEFVLAARPPLFDTLRDSLSALRGQPWEPGPTPDGGTSPE